MATNQSITNIIELLAPEEIESKRPRQHSVKKSAEKFHALLDIYSSMKELMKERGATFGGRALLTGPVGADFETFVHHLATEVPLKVARIRMTSAISRFQMMPDTLKTAVEFAKRNAPVIFLIEDIDALTHGDASAAAITRSEINSLSWDIDEVLLIATTMHPELIDRSILSSFDRIVILPQATTEDRTRLLEEILKGRTDLDIGTIAEMTDGWSFSDAYHLAVSLLMKPEKMGGQMTRDELESIIDEADVIPIGRPGAVQQMVSRIGESFESTLEKGHSAYPDDFIDQLYLMLVGDDYQEAQRVVEILNADMPLSSKEREFLGRYPFLLTGGPDERLTRLLRAKKNHDRLTRIMGR